MGKISPTFAISASQNTMEFGGGLAVGRWLDRR